MEVVIQIEHQSEPRDVAERVFEYACYAWLLRRTPVWSIVIFTDDALWRKPLPDPFWYGFDSENRKQYHHFDIIKVNAEKSGDLIRKRSLPCKLLALKADARRENREALVREILKAAAAMGEEMTTDRLLLICRWIEAYGRIPTGRLNVIKKEANMHLVETTIEEHYIK